MSQNGLTHNDIEECLNDISDEEDLFIVEGEKKINKEKPTKFLMDDSSSDEQGDDEPFCVLNNDSHIFVAQGEAEDDDDDDDVDDSGEEENNQKVAAINHGFYLRESLTAPENDDDDEEEEEEEEQYEAFYLANRTFYTTCHKISRQNSPSYRKRPPYTFLENWMIHYVFSKSQQILLRFPIIRPKVMMTEGDFIYTPHQQITHNDNDHNNNYDEQKGYYIDDADSMMVIDALQPTYNEDTGMNDNDNRYQVYQIYHQGTNDDDDDADEDDSEEAFVIGNEYHMSLSTKNDAYHSEQLPLESSSSVIMDENTWMGHSRYNNHKRLYVVNPDAVKENEQEGLLQTINEDEQEEEEEEEEEEEKKIPNRVQDLTPIHLTMLPEVIQWYRGSYATSAADAGPSTMAQYYQQQQHQPTPSQSLPQNGTLTIPTPALGMLSNFDFNNDRNKQDDDMSSSSSNSSNSSSSSSSSINNSNCSSHSQHSHSRSGSLQSKSSHHNQHSSLDISRSTTVRSVDSDSVGSYQSLADIIAGEGSNSNGVIINNHSYPLNESSTSRYGALSGTRLLNDHGGLRRKSNTSIHVPRIMQISCSLAHAAYVAIELAQAFQENDGLADNEEACRLPASMQRPGHPIVPPTRNDKSIKSFVSCMFDICSVLFSGVEQMLGWKSHQCLQQQFTTRKKLSNINLNNSTSS